MMMRFEKRNNELYCYGRVVDACPVDVVAKRELESMRPQQITRTVFPTFDSDEVVNSLMFESRGTDSLQGTFSLLMLGSAQSSSKVHITPLKGIRCAEEEYRSWIRRQTENGAYHLVVHK